MRLRRAALTIALATLPVVMAASPAHAAPCPLLADPAGDAGYLNMPLLYSAHVDITALDIASGANNVVVQMRLASLDPDLWSNLGPQWIVGFDVDGNRYGLRAARTGLFFLGAGYTSAFGANGTTVPFAIDVVNDTVTWTVPRTLIPELATPGATFSTIFATTTVLAGTADSAFTNTATYVDQTPGCIPAS